MFVDSNSTQANFLHGTGKTLLKINIIYPGKFRSIFMINFE